MIKGTPGNRELTVQRYFRHLKILMRCFRKLKPISIFRCLNTFENNLASRIGHFPITPTILN